MNLRVSCLFWILTLMHVNAVALTTFFDEKTTITIAAIDWCPQICYQDIRKGYIVDLVEEVFKGTQYQLDI